MRPIKFAPSDADTRRGGCFWVNTRSKRRGRESGARKSARAHAHEKNRCRRLAGGVGVGCARAPLSCAPRSYYLATRFLPGALSAKSFVPLCFSRLPPPLRSLSFVTNGRLDCSAKRLAASGQRQRSIRGARAAAPLPCRASACPHALAGRCFAGAVRPASSALRRARGVHRLLARAPRPLLLVSRSAS